MPYCSRKNFARVDAKKAPLRNTNKSDSDGTYRAHLMGEESEIANPEEIKY